MTEINVPDFDRQPLTLSGIAVTTSVSGRMYTARTDELLDDVLGAPPTASREFAADSDLVDLRRDLRSPIRTPAR